MSDVVLKMVGICKEFPGVRALDGVSLEARAGEVLALMGENGAGKSTLMKILSGVWAYPSYQGDIHVRGELMRFAGTRDAERAGIGIIHQELNLIPEMTVAENIFLDRQPRRLGRIDWNKLHADAALVLRRMEIVDIRPTQLVCELTVGSQQIVEIAKALSLDARILVFDEPTSALSDREVAQLFRIIRDLARRGVCIIYISHKMDEIREIADRVAVLRDGRTIGESTPIAAITMDEIIHRMVGRDIQQMFPKERVARGKKVLEVRHLSVAHSTRAGEDRVHDVSFAAYEGEVLGIAGLMGAGRSELVMALFGACARGDVRGDVYLDDSKLDIRSPADAIASGIALVPEDRKRLGLILGQSVLHNLGLASLRQLSSRLGVMDARRERVLARERVDELRIRTPGVEALIDTLSGGNQQKVVVGRWLSTRPRILILDEPTRGVDVGAKVEIYKLMNELVRRGVSVIMVSSDLPEIMGMSDRILVMCEGRKAGEFLRDQVTREEIMHHATQLGEGAA